MPTDAVGVGNLVGGKGKLSASCTENPAAGGAGGPGGMPGGAGGGVAGGSSGGLGATTGFPDMPFIICPAACWNAVKGSPPIG